jgi:putative membrane protein insertion efficiency factor
MHSIFRKALAILFWLPATASIMLVRIYQKTLSPDHGLLKVLYPYGYCRHQPTCSEYAILTLKKELYPVALFLIIKRLLSCHPWKQPSDERLKSIIKRTYS